MNEKKNDGKRQILKCIVFEENSNFLTHYICFNIEKMNLTKVAIVLNYLFISKCRSLDTDITTCIF